GFQHAERAALNSIASIDVSHATLYATLEPCCHHGRTLPCVDIIFERKIKRVVVGERDFAAQVQGRSLAILQEQGVDVSLFEPHVFEKEAWFTTQPFFFAQKNKRPRVTLKWAETQDGYIAPREGVSGKISGSAAAFITAALRNYHKFTLATPGTTAIDAPQLNVRFDTPLASLENSGLSNFFQELLYLQSSLAKITDDQHTSIKRAERGFILDEASVSEKFLTRQENMGGRYTFFPFEKSDWKNNFKTSAEKVFTQIYSRGFNSVLVEAGPTFARLLLSHGFVDAVVVYRSKNKTAQNLWGDKGRRVPFADFTSRFALLEYGDLGDDELFFYRRKNHDR
ncbi:MAG TPA: dihydrofolate reductase family protein, partial [Turneriella sp.]|nr:dihydrofolate reductase family protein [Turneriella sp.]